MVRQAHHERNQKITALLESVEAFNQPSHWLCTQTFYQALKLVSPQLPKF